MTKREKEELKKLVKDKAIRQYFIEKMRIRLSNLWQSKQTKSRMYHETKKRYHIFENKIDEIDNRILQIVPPETPYSYLQFRIVD